MRRGRPVACVDEIVTTFRPLVCLSFSGATPAAFHTAYLIYLFVEWLAYLCMRYYIVFFSNLFSCLVCRDIL
jgi:hypothetical protein